MASVKLYTHPGMRMCEIVSFECSVCRRVGGGGGAVDGEEGWDQICLLRVGVIFGHLW